MCITMRTDLDNFVTFWLLSLVRTFIPPSKNYNVSFRGNTYIIHHRYKSKPGRMFAYKCSKSNQVSKAGRKPEVGGRCCPVCFFGAGLAFKGRKAGIDIIVNTVNR